MSALGGQHLTEIGMAGISVQYFTVV